MKENELQSVILGLKNHVRSVREESKKSLEKLAEDFKVSWEAKHVLSPDFMLKSARFSFIIYQEMKITRNLELIKLFLMTLLSIGGRGPFFAWKFFAYGDVHQNILIDIIKKFPEHMRLIFAYQYSLDDISTRRHFGTMVKFLLRDIYDRDLIIKFLVYLYDQDALLDYVFDDTCKKMKIRKTVIQKELKDNNTEEKIKGIKTIGILGDINGYHSCDKLLLQDEQPSVHITCIEMLGKSNLRNDQSIINAISSHLKNKDYVIASQAFKSLVSLKVSGLEEILRNISPDLILKLSEDYEWLSVLEWKDLNIILNVIPSEKLYVTRAEIINRIVRNKPDKFTFLLNRYVKSPDDNIKEEASKLLKKLDSIIQKEKEEASKYGMPEFLQQPKTSKGFFEKIVGKKSNNNLKKLLNRESVQKVDFHGEAFSDLDLSGINLREVNFDGAVFSDVNLSFSKLYSVTFNGAKFENVKMENAVLDFVSFNNATFKNVSFTNSKFNLCDFSDSWIYNSSFDSAKLQISLFINARIIKTNFTHSDLTEASFVGSDLILTIFNSANLHLSEFSLAKGKLCKFYDVDFTTVYMEQASLNTHSAKLDEIVIPNNFFHKDTFDTEGFKILFLSEEMEKRREIFLNYNYRITELTIDTLNPEQGDLFELVPFLINSNLGLLPEDKPVTDAPAGIYNYFPHTRIIQLAKKYFNFDETQPIPDKNQSIEGLFSIGSTGTIAQSSDSDIDYWVCLEEEKLSGEEIKLLNTKLRAIEEWANDTFYTELHFFVVDLTMVREDLYGSSDMESCGSAQGKILKEEFYRTMLYISGKIPLWCVTPPYIDDRDYQYYLSISSLFKKDYLDLGNISVIPKGEYFGATIWQVFKSLKSPYKSVMKMSLLEKYIQEEKQQGLLCDRLKTIWSPGRCDMRYQDPYLLLFEETMKYYQKTKQKKIESLLLICFYLKLGIKSIEDYDKSVLGTKKRLLKEYMKSLSWSKIKAQEFSDLREWPVEKIFWLSTLINNYMIKTYKKLSDFLQKTDTKETFITPQDMTILGRKMFVQFSKQTYKVEKLPFMVHGNTLFKQLYLRYNQDERGHATWNLINLKIITGIEKHSEEEILKKMDRIEEIAIWLVFNGLYSPSTLLKLMPNPTPVSLQDTIDLLKELYDFFTLKEIESISPKALIDIKIVNKMFVVMNYNINRKIKIINEYTVIFTTNWGECFCKVFYNKEGFLSVDNAVSNIIKQFNFPYSTDKIRVYIPHSAKKYLIQ